MKRKVRQGQTWYILVNVAYEEYDIYQIFIQKVTSHSIYYNIIFPGVKVNYVCSYSTSLQIFKNGAIFSFRKALSKVKCLTKCYSIIQLR